MKCVNCGNQTYIDIKLDSNDITMKACTKCGHLEYFYRMDKVKMLTEIDLLNTQAEALEIIATNANLDVKNQKEAEDKIEAIEAKVLKIKNKMKKLK
jgi:predicted  nucleic acid-binding Zn-ribbon protein